MTEPENEIKELIPPRKRRGYLRPLIWLAEAFAFVAVLCVLAFALLSWRLNSGPVTFDGLNTFVVEMLSRQFDSDYNVEASHSQIVKNTQGINLLVENIHVRDHSGAEVIAIPQAVLTFDGTSLLRLDPKPSNIEFVGLTISLTIFKQGNVSFSFNPSQSATEVTTGPMPKADVVSEPAPLRIASFIDALFAENSALSILQRARMRDGTLMIDDQRNDRKLSYSNAAFSLLRSPGKALDLSVTAVGPSGRWTVDGALMGEPDKPRKMRLRVKDLAVSELLGFASKGVLPVTTDMPVSFETGLTIQADGTLSSLEGQITGGKAIVSFEMEGAEPIAITSLSGRFGLMDEGRAIGFTDLSLLGQAMHWQGQGQLVFPKDRSTPWAFLFEGKDSLIALESLDKRPVSVNRWVLEGQITQGFRGVTVQKLQLDGPQVMIGLAGRFGSFPDFVGVDYTVHGERMEVRDALTFWPKFSVPETRAYLVQRLEAGHLEQIDFMMRLDPEQLIAAFAEKPVPEDAILLNAKISAAVMRPEDGLPLLRDLYGTVRVTGTKAIVVADQGKVAIGDKSLGIHDGQFIINDTSVRPSVANITFKLKGPASGLIEALQMPALRGLTPPKLQPDQVRGQVDMTASVLLPLMPSPSAQDVKTEAQGRFSQFSVDRVFGKERLDNGALGFSFGSDGLTIKGDARLAGALVHLVYQQGRKDKEPTIQLNLSIDDATRQKQGIKWGQQLVGPIAAKVLIAPAPAKPGAQVELDLTKATVNGLMPSWTKPAGRNAKLSFRMLSGADDSTLLRDLVLDGGPNVSVRGDVDLAHDGSITQAQLPAVKLSANDEMRVEMDRAGPVLKVQIRAATLDARPFLKQVFSASSTTTSSSSDLDIDLKAGSLTGYAGQTMQNVDLRMGHRGGEIRDFRLSGRFGAQSVIGQMGRSEAGASALLIESADAGDFLRFLDLYRRMQGGRIVLQIATAGEPRNGLIIVNDFALKDDPALSGAMKVQPPPAGQPGAQQSGESNIVNFSKLRAQYTLGGGKFIVQDAVMWGTSMGGTLEGTLDYAADRSDMTGTFVPLYGLNNILTQIPLFGPLLMGGSNAGIFAINFRISGTVTSPTVSINPLSAVAPGIFRKLFLFGVGKTDAPATAPPSRGPQPKTP
jgi:hypothetical protein